jgi:hypothetical protein
VGAASACIPLFFKRGGRDLPGQSRLPFGELRLKKPLPQSKDNQNKIKKFLLRFDRPFSLAGGWAES